MHYSFRLGQVAHMKFSAQHLKAIQAQKNRRHKEIRVSNSQEIIGYELSSQDISNGKCLETSITFCRHRHKNIQTVLY